MTVKRLATLALFTSIALIIYMVESLIPLPLPIPGVKLGLANTVTLFMLFMGSGKREPSTIYPIYMVYVVLICRVLLGALIMGRPVMLLYSLVGGLLAVSVQILTKRFVTENQIWVCGAIGAVFHNAGQILVAIIITGTPSIAVYLPVLIIAGIFTGILTGLIAQFAVRRLKLINVY